MSLGLAIFTGGYVIVCLMVGVCGRNTRLGFLASGLLALVLTPPIMLFLIYLLGPRAVAQPAR